jgi:hypothetical protein
MHMGEGIVRGAFERPVTAPPLGYEEKSGVAVPRRGNAIAPDAGPWAAGLDRE